MKGQLIRLLLLLVFATCAVPAVAQAQLPPLRAPAESPPPGAAPPGNVVAPGFWRQFMADVRREQLRLQRQMAGAVRTLSDAPAMGPAFVLAGLSFMYGVFHAVGPGHGKAVIASYLVASRARMRRGVLLAVMSSLVQALAAVALVLLLVVVLQFSNLDATARVRWLEITSYALVVALGLGMLVAAIRHAFRGEPAGCSGHAHHHGHNHARTAPADGGFGRLAAMALAIGIRPCSGAVIVLLFALAQGALAIGIASAFAMAAGTAATVAALAVLTVLARDAATRIARSRGRWERRLHAALGIAGATAIVLFGSLLLAAAIGGGGLG